MKTLEIHGIEDMPLVDVDLPTPGPGEVLVQVAYCGICGSDFPRYFEGAVHSFPQTLGHEFSGVVAAVGPAFENAAGPGAELGSVDGSDAGAVAASSADDAAAASASGLGTPSTGTGALSTGPAAPNAASPGPTNVAATASASSTGASSTSSGAPSVTSPVAEKAGVPASTTDTGGVASTGPIVASAGPVKVGQHVAVAPLVPCHECSPCLAGAPALCPNYSFIGSRRQGALAQYVLAPARNLVPLPEGMTLRDAALVEPLTVAIHGLERATYDGVDHVAVFGAGVIGLLTVQALKARGIPHVTSIDIQPDKLALAGRLGADATVLGSDVEQVFADPQLRPQVAIETAGSPVTQVQAVSTVANGGQVVFVGTCTQPVTFEPEQFERILRGELRLTGSWMSYSAPFPGHEWRQAVEAIAAGAVDVSELVSGEYGLDEGAKPFEDVRQAGGSLLKVLYRVGGEEAGRVP